MPFALIGLFLGYVLLYGIKTPVKPSQFGELPQHGYEVSQGDEADPNGIPLGDLATWVGAAGSIILGVGMYLLSLRLYRVSVTQMRLLGRANNTADKAHELAVQIERGRFTVTKSAVIPGTKTLACTIKNIGRSNAKLESTSAHIEGFAGFSTKHHPIAKSIATSILWNAHVSPGKSFKVNGGAGYEIPDECFNPDGTLGVFVVQYEVFYSSMERSFVHRCAWMHVGPDAATRHVVAEYEFDGETKGRKFFVRGFGPESPE